MTANAMQEEFLGGLESAGQILSLFNWLPEAHLYMKDREGRFMAVNLASARRNGFEDPADLIGKTDFDLHPPQMAAAYVEEDRKVMEGKREIPEQIWLVYDYLGLQRWFVSTKIPLFGKKGEVVGIAGIMRPLETAGHLRESYQGLAPVVEHVLEHFDEKIQAGTLAELVGLSVSQLNRRFRRLFGIAPMQLVLRVRINAARTMLARGSSELGAIALDCGFYDQGQFGRIFKRETGLTPGDYRRRYQSGTFGGA
ncbi:MAG: helix-turn-helix domain-containing protein [Akkermansiaceae bacterium]